MAQEIHLGDTIYISSRRAAEITGYKQDYIGQLARAGKILGKRMGGLWYVLEESLRGHKATADAYVPTPPHLRADATSASHPDSLVSFDGRNYVSSSEAARLTSYHPDYIGQLARTAKILSRQVGNRWFVDLDGLTSHKAEKDRLLGAVQAESVGLRTVVSSGSVGELSRNTMPQPYFTYTADNGDLIPSLIEGISPAAIEKESIAIPIRIVHSARYGGERVEEKTTMSPRSRSKAYTALTISLMTIVIVIAFNINLFSGNAVFTGIKERPQILKNTALAGFFADNVENIGAYMQGIVVKKLEYQRQAK